MKFILLLSTFLLSFYITPEHVEAAPKESLLLTMTVTNHRYCRNNIYDGEYDLILDLRLHYKNIGKQPIILHRGSNLITYYKVGNDLKSLSHAKYGHILWMTSNNEGVTEDGSTPSSNFIILKPGEEYGIESKMRFPSAKEFLTVGTQYLQVIILTWTGSKTQAQKLRRKWERTGELRYKPANSTPMSFRVEKEPEVVECPHDA